MRATVLLVILALGLSAGCNTTATRDPFAREEDPNVEIQGLAVVVAGALGQTGAALQDTAARIGGRSPKYLEWARALADPNARPDALREAMLGLVDYDYGRKPPYTEAYAEFARNSNHALVRAAAIRALNISRDRSATGLFIEALEDEAPSVRLEAAKALSNVPDPTAVPALLARARNGSEQLDVRIAAIDALKHAEASDPLLGLVSLLEADDFSLAWQSRRSLITATGEDHGFDSLAWRRALVGGEG